MISKTKDTRTKMPVWLKYNPADWQCARKDNKRFAKTQQIPTPQKRTYETNNDI